MVTAGLQSKVITMTIALTPRQREQLARIAEQERLP
jgi:hypothetical protein